MSEALTFWQGIARLPEQAQQSFWDAGQALSRHIGEPPTPRRLTYDTSRPPPGMPWYERLFFYMGQGQYNQAVSQQYQAEATIQGARWLWGALQGDFNKNPTNGQLIVGGLISLIPLVDQACDVRDVIANCITLSDEQARQDNENWIALGLTCIGFVPEFGSAIKTVAKYTLRQGDDLLSLLRHMEWLERSFERLRVACPWTRAPIDWLRNFNWQQAAQQAAQHARQAFDRARANAEAAARYAIGAIKTKLEQLAALFRQIADRITGTLDEVCQRVKARIDSLLRRERAEAGNYSATPGASTGRHTQDETPPPRDNDRRQGNSLGRCTLRPYRPDTCAPNTGHHVVPDRVFRIGDRANGERIPGGPSESEGLVICVQGRDLNRSQEHGRIHRIYDEQERALGGAGTPPGTASIGALEMIAANAVAQVTGCNAAAIGAQLRAYHQARGLSPTARVRADPGGRISRTLDPRELGTGQSPARPRL